MLKISRNGHGSGGGQDTITLKLEGRIVGPWVDELRDACEDHLRKAGRLELDLREVTFADERGFAELARLRGLGVPLRGCLPFVQEQLKSR